MAQPNTLLLLLMLLALASAHPHATASCPVPATYSQLHHGHITIGMGATLQLQTTTDALCYDYSLPTPFQAQPGVAIAVHRLEAQQTSSLFFSIRVSKSQSLSSLSFLVRTQWKYTQWTLFSVSFLAEDHIFYEANSFSVDTTPLAGCSHSKEVKVILPYKQANFNSSNAVVFLHGFEMSTEGSQTVQPFEVQMLT